MAGIALNDDSEIVLSSQTIHLWERRRIELAAWVDRDKLKIKDKLTVELEGFTVDAELCTALSIIRNLKIHTEFSCAGVSLVDDPFDHSLYAYITLSASERTERFVAFVQRLMKHRLLVTFEPGRKRYDLSSFFIGHNRSFCLLIQRCAEAYAQADGNAAERLPS
ncbi:hypothetical protein L1N85_09060 [Paenibacillus alkaliterrae]|uniref:hypothetical protein n=1 Tax=Paenibacillus alkaliterrae TaxID=320909 RepID=UPI001F38D70C|nr:hypothetical protein [Paenibacillus alkaliterrae]MCF2938584.1 hypothetical protein [Paenibacillus alkaliterrae]